MRLVYSFQILSVLFSCSLSKISLNNRKVNKKKNSLKNKLRSNLGIKTHFRWQPTKVKTGVPTTKKTGDEYCKSD